MDKKPEITYSLGRFEPQVFVKVFSLLIVILAGLSLLASYLMDQSLEGIIVGQGLYRFILLPFFLAGGIAYITRHSTLKVTHVTKRKLDKLVTEAMRKEGYELRKDKDQVMVFDPEISGIVSLNQWMENVTITVKFKNHNMTIVGPRRIMRNMHDRVKFGLDFKEALRLEPAQ
jgi:hypothetical protein